MSVENKVSAGMRKGFLRIYISATVIWMAYWNLNLITRVNNVEYNVIGRDAFWTMMVIDNVIVPVAGYCFLFVWLPWIYRGFKK